MDIKPLHPGYGALYKPEVEIDGYHTLVDQGYTLSTSSASDKQSPIPTEDIVNHQGRAATALISSFWKKVPWVWSKLLSRRWSPQSSAGAARVDARTVHIGTAERLESVETREAKRKTNHTVISPLRAFPAPLLGFFLVSYDGTPYRHGVLVVTLCTSPDLDVDLYPDLKPQDDLTSLPSSWPAVS